LCSQRELPPHSLQNDFCFPCGRFELPLLTVFSFMFPLQLFPSNQGRIQSWQYKIKNMSTIWNEKEDKCESLQTSIYKSITKLPFLLLLSCWSLSSPSSGSSLNTRSILKKLRITFINNKL
jgi:hypothetical protein